MKKERSWEEKYLHFIYKFWAGRYDKYVDHRWNFNRQTPIEKLAISKGDKILEIGVGTGLNLPHYPPQCSVIGIDLSEEMMSKADKKQCKAKATLIVADARKLPFPDNHFDKALATYVLRVSPQPEKITREVSRVVKSKGSFCLVDRFKGEGGIFCKLHELILFMLGGGKDYLLEELINGTPWKVRFNEPFGSRKNTRMILLQNEKQRNS